MTAEGRERKAAQKKEKIEQENHEWFNVVTTVTELNNILDVQA